MTFCAKVENYDEKNRKWSVKLWRWTCYWVKIVGTFNPVLLFHGWRWYLSWLRISLLLFLLSWDKLGCRNLQTKQRTGLHGTRWHSWISWENRIQWREENMHGWKMSQTEPSAALSNIWNKEDLIIVILGTL